MIWSPFETWFALDLSSSRDFAILVFSKLCILKILELIFKKFIFYGKNINTDIETSGVDIYNIIPYFFTIIMTMIVMNIERTIWNIFFAIFL